MKKNKQRLLRGVNLGLAGVLSLLGFSGCDKLLDEPVDEYGTPHADFIVSGYVKDNNGLPLRNIRVVVPQVVHFQKSTSTFIPDETDIKRPVNDTLYTASDGSFEFKYTEFPSRQIGVEMEFEDPSVSPAYTPVDTVIPFSESELQGGESWYKGKAEKKVNIVLKKHPHED